MYSPTKHQHISARQGPKYPPTHSQVIGLYTTAELPILPMFRDMPPYHFFRVRLNRGKCVEVNGWLGFLFLFGFLVLVFGHSVLIFA